jgi:hypothetical protein
MTKTALVEKAVKSRETEQPIPIEDYPAYQEMFALLGKDKNRKHSA